VGAAQATQAGPQRSSLSQVAQLPPKQVVPGSQARPQAPQLVFDCAVQ
jgi:hypothetical protein